jgi:hydroxymethylglutaryl-CoA lyase
MPYPSRVKIVEVGPRDGLQNEHAFVPTASKIAFINLLSQCGFPSIEIASFVNPKKVPQLADAEAVCAGITRHPHINYSALVPNLRGLERALDAKLAQLAIFTAASETFNRHNIGCDIEESLNRFAPVIDRAHAADLTVRAYISCVLGCPYEGTIPVAKVVDLAFRLHTMGCDEISLGDTIGAGTPLQARGLLTAVARRVPIGQLAVHFHDTRGQALANILACLELGISTIDASVSGLGGCPYAPGASGNVATEDLVYMLHGMDITTGIDLEMLIDAGRFINKSLNRSNGSRVGQAGLAICADTADAIQAG